MIGRRGMVAALTVTVLGAILVLGTSRQSRWTAGGLLLTNGGVPGAAALALAALAGVGLLLLARGAVRSVVGTLLVCCGIAVVIVDVRVGRPEGIAAGPLGGQVLHLHRSVWFWLTAAGGVAIAIGGALTAARGHRWPTSRRDYPGASAPAPKDAWTALDRGDDPTL